MNAPGKIDLASFAMQPGEGRVLDMAVPVEPFEFGGQHYTVGEGRASVHLDLSRTAGGYVFRLRCAGALDGPCMRCFDSIGIEFKIDMREAHEPGLGAEVRSDYINFESELDLEQCLRDAIGLALPARLSGELNDVGGCGLCGRTKEQLTKLGLGVEEAHEPDPRWAKLRELELE